MSDAVMHQSAVDAPISEFVRRLSGRLSPDAVLRENEPLAKKTTIGVGGPARCYSEPASIEDLRVLLREARGCGVPVFLLGRGSNVIVPDDGVPGLVLRLQSSRWREIAAREDGRLWAGAGARLRKLCGEACRLGLGGLEFLEGIPGTVGGALRMNAGAMNGWFFDVVEEVRLMTYAGEEKVFLKDQLHYDYRVCHELLNTIALGAVIAAPGREEEAAIRRRLAEFQEKRTGAQPKESSAGCIFKNPPGVSAGRIIDELGLKGKRIGDAEVSLMHGNFIINRGAATASEVIQLVRELRDEVRRRKNFEMEPEVLLFGKQWSDVF